MFDSYEAFRESSGGSDGDKLFSVGWFVDAGISLGLVLVAGMMSGLTMGLVSLDATQLSIVQRLGDEEAKRKAKSLLWFTRNHHLTLVTLLLANAGAAEALPLFLDKLVPEYIAIILSVTFVLIFGEIIPSAVCTGPQQVDIASFTAPLVYFLMFILFPIAYPIAKLLDVCLGDDHEMGTRFQRRTELREFIRLHGRGAARHGHGSAEDGEDEQDGGGGQDDDETVALRRRAKERERIRRRLRKMHVLGMFLANGGGKGDRPQGTNQGTSEEDAGEQSEGGPGSAAATPLGSEIDAELSPVGGALPPTGPGTGPAGAGADHVDDLQQQQLRSFSALASAAGTRKRQTELAQALKDAARLAEEKGADEMERRRLDDLTDGFLHYGDDGDSTSSSSGGGNGGGPGAGDGGPGNKASVGSYGTQSAVVSSIAAGGGDSSPLSGDAKAAARTSASGLPPRMRRSATHAAGRGVVAVGGQAAGAVKRGAAGFFVFRKQPAALPGMAVVPSGQSPQLGPQAGSLSASATTPLLASADGVGTASRSLSGYPVAIRSEGLVGDEGEGLMLGSDSEGETAGGKLVRLVSIGRQATPMGPSAALAGSAAVESAATAEDASVESMMLSEDEVKIMSGCLMLGQLTVGDVAQPDVFALSTEDRLDDRTMQAILGSTHSRIPVVYGRDKHKVAGLLLVKLLIPLSPAECKPIREVPLLKPIVLHPDTTLLNALNVFQTGRGHLAVVTRQTEEMKASLQARRPPPDSVRILGIVTLENLLEELIQEDILDEMDVGAGAAADGSIEGGVLSGRGVAATSR